MNLPSFKPNQLKLLLPALGGGALLLRLLLFATGVDDKGLVVSGHPAWTGMLLLTAAAAVVLFLGIRPLRGPAAHRAGFPRSVPAAAGCALGAVSAGIAAWQHFRTGPAGIAVPNPLATAGYYLSVAVMFLAALAFVLIAICRLAGKKPHFLLHCLICVYFALHLLNMYQTWSFDPQLQDYCFQLFACIALTMTAYHLASFDIDKGSHRMLWFWGLAAVYLCCVCLGTSDSLLFLSGGLWAFTNLSPLRRPRRRRAAQPPVSTTEL